MPLSEEELRLLDQMERALVADDPRLASTMRGTGIRKQARRHMVVGAVGFFAGIALMMSGAVWQLIWLGVIGFLMMLGTAYFTVTAWRGQNSAPEDETGPSAGTDRAFKVVQGGKAKKSGRSGKPPGSLMDRMEERWKKRREGDY